MDSASGKKDKDFLKQAKKKIKTGLTVAILALICVVFMFFGPTPTSIGQGAGVAIVVNKEPISKLLYDQQLEASQKRFMSQFGDKDSSSFLNMFQQHLKTNTQNSLIDFYLVNQVMNDSGYRVSGAEIRDKLTQMPMFQQNKTFKRHLYQNFLENSHYTPQSYENLIAREIQYFKVQGLFNESLALSEEFGKRFEQIYKTQVSLSWLSLDLKDWVKKNTKLSNKDVTAYVEKHREDLKSKVSNSESEVEFTKKAKEEMLDAEQDKMAKKLEALFKDKKFAQMRQFMKKKGMKLKDKKRFSLWVSHIPDYPSDSKEVLKFLLANKQPTRGKNKALFYELKNNRLVLAQLNGVKRGVKSLTKEIKEKNADWEEGRLASESYKNWMASLRKSGRH